MLAQAGGFPIDPYLERGCLEEDTAFCRAAIPLRAGEYPEIIPVPALLRKIGCFCGALNHPGPIQPAVPIRQNPDADKPLLKNVNRKAGAAGVSA
jgi:hypothetical protein